MSGKPNGMLNDFLNEVTKIEDCNSELYVKGPEVETYREHHEKLMDTNASYRNVFQKYVRARSPADKLSDWALKDGPPERNFVLNGAGTLAKTFTAFAVVWPLVPSLVYRKLQLSGYYKEFRR